LPRDSVVIYYYLLKELIVNQKSAVCPLMEIITKSRNPRRFSTEQIQEQQTRPLNLGPSLRDVTDLCRLDTIRPRKICTKYHIRIIIYPYLGRNQSFLREL
jgi:hypothetical protein